MSEPFDGWRRIRTFESVANRFTVCPLWPLGNPSLNRNLLYMKYLNNASTFLINCRKLLYIVYCRTFLDISSGEILFVIFFGKSSRRKSRNLVI